MMMMMMMMMMMIVVVVVVVMVMSLCCVAREICQHVDDGTTADQQRVRTEFWFHCLREKYHILGKEIDISWQSPRSSSCECYFSAVIM